MLIEEPDTVIVDDAVNMIVVDGVAVTLTFADEVQDTDIVLELVDEAVCVIVFGPVTVILGEDVPDTETVDVLLDAGDLVFVIVRIDVGDIEVVDDVVLDILAEAVVVGVRVDVLEPTIERVLVEEAVVVLDEVIVPVSVVVLTILFVPFTEDDADGEPDGDFEVDIDFVFVGVPDAVLETSAVLLSCELAEAVFVEDIEPVDVFVTVIVRVPVLDPVSV